MDKATLDFHRIDEIFEKIDRLAQEGKFEQVDVVLEEVDILETTTSELITYLTATLVIRLQLKFRVRFFESVDKELRSRPNWNEKLLYGLK